MQLRLHKRVRIMKLNNPIFAEKIKLINNQTTIIKKIRHTSLPAIRPPKLASKEYSPISNCRGGGQLPIFGFFWLIIENLIQFKLILKGIRHKILLLVSVFHQDKRFKTPFIPPLFSVLEINFHSPYFFHPFPFIRPPYN